MSTLREAAQQALETLEKSRVFVTTREKIKHPEGTEWYDGRITALRAALAQEEQEPVTWGVDWGRDGDRPCCTIIKRHADGTQEVVAVEYGPPRREWMSLTEEDIWTLAAKHMDTVLGRLHFARAIEAALKEKNHD
jgi:hypothetical protein